MNNQLAIFFVILALSCSGAKGVRLSRCALAQRILKSGSTEGEKAAGTTALPKLLRFNKSRLARALTLPNLNDIDLYQVPELASNPEDLVRWILDQQKTDLSILDPRFPPQKRAENHRRLNQIIEELNKADKQQSLSYLSFLRLAFEAMALVGSEHQNMPHYEIKNSVEMCAQVFERAHVLPVLFFSDEVMTRRDIIEMNLSGLVPVQFVSDFKVADGERMDPATFASHDMTHLRDAARMVRIEDAPRQKGDKTRIEKEVGSRRRLVSELFKRLDREPPQRIDWVENILLEVMHEGTAWSSNRDNRDFFQWMADAANNRQDREAVASELLRDGGSRGEFDAAFDWLLSNFRAINTISHQSESSFDF